MNILKNKRILMGVGGGISSYKSLEVIRLLRQQGALVRVAPTRAALAFIQPMTFEAISGQKPILDVLACEDGIIPHVEEAYASDLVLVAPATCNLLARMCTGMADEEILAALLAFRGPVCVAPAMESNMWLHDATQNNIGILIKRGVDIIGPEQGELASGRTGPGRMSSPNMILAHVIRALTPSTLTGRTLLITAGPTVEDIDPVRFISNRSTGRMGLALAFAAAARNAHVILIHGPVDDSIPISGNITKVPVRSAREMHNAVMHSMGQADAAILCAAVSDFTPAAVAKEKIKKEGDSLQTLELTRTRDILAELGALKDRPFLVGFAAETENMEANAHAKLQSKNCDLICANNISEEDCGFGAEDNHLVILGRDGSRIELARKAKSEIANEVMDLVASRLSSLSRKG